MKKPFTYGSVCSGVEAATVAWKQLGWEAAWFSQFDPEHDYSKGKLDFPSLVLKHHYPDVPNLGDMLKIEERPEFNDRSIQLLIGGTPCQSFSIAGLRKGLDDARGNLAFKFCQILARKQPRWFIWENVPGVLSSYTGDEPPSDLEEGAEWRTDENSDFGSIINGFRECGYSIAYRILDAQYFGVAQRRRRIFVVGYLGDWRPAAAVLLERESLRGDSEPCRETGKDIAGTLAASTYSGGAGGRPEAAAGNLFQPVDRDIAPTLDCRAGRSGETSFATSGGLAVVTKVPSHCDGSELHPTLTQSNSTAGIGQSNQEIFSQRGAGLVGVRPIHDKATRFAGGGDGREDDGAQNGLGIGKESDPSPTIDTTSRHAVFIDSAVRMTGLGEYVEDGTASTIKARDYKDATDLTCFSHKDYGNDALDNLSPTLMNQHNQLAVAAGFKGCQSEGGIGYEEHMAPTLTGDPSHYAQCVHIDGGETARTLTARYDSSPHTNGGINIMGTGMQVRRLTPRECERLQGFPDDYTLIPLNEGGGKMAADGPRYKAMGNSFAVPVVRWIGERIQLWEELHGQNSD